METVKIIFTDGWYPEERTLKGTFRWMRKHAKFTLEGLPTKGERTLILRGGHPLLEGKNPKLKVYTNKEILGEQEIFESIQSYPFPLRNHTENSEIFLELDHTFQLEKQNDQRELGVMIENIMIHTKRNPSFPSILEIETSTHCNINPPCVMCYPRLFDKRQFKGEIAKSVSEKLNLHLSHFRTISLHGVGEPLLGKNLFVILDNINTDMTDVQFNSNGLLLTEEMSRKLIAKKLKLIDFSLDAATPETYKKIRRSDFTRVMKNIRKLKEIKNELDVKYPVIKFNMTLMNENLPEVIPFIEMASRFGAEIVHLGLLNPYKEYRVENEDFIFNYIEQMIDTESDFFKKTIKQAKQRAAEMGIKLYLEFSAYYS
jgi:molybdenum cofactor biosynthesis enzyme MoaA